LERQGFIQTKPSPADGRVRHAALTPKGRREVTALDRGSQDVAASVLAPLGESQRERLMAAMADVERLMRASAVVVTPANPNGAEARACIAAYMRELNARFETGFDPANSVLAAPDELAPPAGQFLIARLDGEAVGCGGLRVTGHQ